MYDLAWYHLCTGLGLQQKTNLVPRAQHYLQSGLQHVKALSILARKPSWPLYSNTQIEEEFVRKVLIISPGSLDNGKDGRLQSDNTDQKDKANH